MHYKAKVIALQMLRSVLQFQPLHRTAVLWFLSGIFLLRVTELIQRSVAICCDDFASRLAELAEHFGARVACYTVTYTGISADAQREAREFLSRILQQRLKHRGRRKD